MLIVALYLVREFVNALTPDTISQLAHIAGGLIGGIFGFIFARAKNPVLPGPAPDAAPAKKE